MDQEFNAGSLVPDGQTVSWTEESGITFYMHREGDKLHMKWSSPDLQTLFDANAAEAADFNASGSHGNLVKQASIPSQLYWQWQREGIIDDKVALKRRLNDGDYSKLRTSTWRV
jgi:hypothetical protein